MKAIIILISLFFLNCLTVDKEFLAKEGNIKLVEKNKTCGDITKEVTIWKILYGTTDFGENDAESIFDGLNKKTPYFIEEKITGIDMIVTLVVGLFSTITRSTLLITSCEGKKKKKCYLDFNDLYDCPKAVYKKRVIKRKTCIKRKRRYRKVRKRIIYR